MVDEKVEGTIEEISPGEASGEFSWRLRFVSSRLDAKSRKVYLVATGFFLCIFLGTIWPLHGFFARIRPLVLGLPFSLFYLAALLIMTFAVLLSVFLWEGGQSNRERDS